MDKVIRQITANIGTPVYLYRQDIIRRQWDTLQRNKPTGLKIYYAVKGNPNLSILRFFQRIGAGAEIASGGELFLALKAGFSPEDIIYTGPGKTDEEMEEAVLHSIRTIHVESLHEARRLQSICQKHNRKQSILVRINAIREVKTQVQFSGCPSPFGISEEVIKEILPQILALPHLEFEGIHVYNASGILEYNLLLENVRNVFSLVNDLETKMNLRINTIDFGGGLGVDYSDQNLQVDVGQFYTGFSSLIREFGFHDRQFILEIARYLMAESGYYITRVLDKKDSRGKTFVIVDGGIHHFMRTALFGVNHPAKILQNLPQVNEEVVQVTGTLCTNIDKILKDISLPKPQIGDLLIIEKAGCYALSAAINHFLSHEMPPEVLLDNDQWSIIRKRGKHADLLLNQV